MRLTAASIRPYGDRGLLVEVGGPAEVHRLRTAVLEAGLAIDAVPGWSSLLVRTADPHRPDGQAILRGHLLALTLPDTGTEPGPEQVREPFVINVGYDGPDLAEVADLAGRTVPEVVALHTEPVYTVALLGFARGFPYLAGLHPDLAAVPRLETPRAHVPAGSVGIAGGQTGVYPMATPGGWRLLGRSDTVLFDPTRRPPSPLEPGRRVRFRAIGQQV